MYQVLYRKWRPRKYEDVVGQKNITDTLKNEVINKHIAHAYLFTGSRGTGKTTCARIFSLAVNCRNPIDGDPCGVCDICKESQADALLDISEIDAASNNGVENIRLIKEEIFLVPSLCKFRVYIIDEAHMLSSAAANALLKILEEPPSHAIFILATTEMHKIPSTIASRCQKFEFHRIEREDMAQRINFICEQEGIKISPLVVDIVTELSDGAMRDALSLLDRCVSCLGKNLNSDESVEKVKSILGVTDKILTDKLMQYIIKKQPQEALRLVQELYQQSRSMTGLCEELMQKFREKLDDILVNGGNTFLRELDYMVRCLDVLKESYKNMSSGVNKKLEMEVALVKMCYIDDICLDDSSNRALKKDVLSQTGYTGSSKDSVNTKKPPDSPKESDSEVQKSTSKSSKCDPPLQSGNSTQEDDSQSLQKFENWQGVVEYLKENSGSRSMSVMLKDCTAYKMGNCVLLDTDKVLVKNFLAKASNKKILEDAVNAVTGQNYKLGLYKQDAGTKNAPSDKDPLEEFSQNLLKNDVNMKFE